MTLMEDKRLAGGGAGGVATVWDLATQHKTQGFTRTDRKVEKSVILGLSPSPDNETLLMTSLSSVSVHLVRFQPPGHRVMIGGDGANVGTPGHMETVASHRASDCLVTSIHWKMPEPEEKYS